METVGGFFFSLRLVPPTPPSASAAPSVGERRAPAPRTGNHQAHGQPVGTQATGRFTSPYGSQVPLQPHQHRAASQTAGRRAGNVQVYSQLCRRTGNISATGYLLAHRPLAAAPTPVGAQKLCGLTASVQRACAAQAACKLTGNPQAPSHLAAALLPAGSQTTTASQKTQIHRQLAGSSAPQTTCTKAHKQSPGSRTPAASKAASPAPCAAQAWQALRVRQFHHKSRPYRPTSGPQ